MEDRLAGLFERIKKKGDEYLGYPLAKDFKFSDLASFLDLPINNVGDPFSPSTLGIDTKDMEREVIQFFSQLLRAKNDEVWGYITNGGSEGNLYGLYVARESFRNAIVYYSESTHYSVKKNLHLLNIPNIVIRSDDSGEMDYDDLEQAILLRRDRAAIFFLNIGTTMKEAIDSIEEVKRIIKKYAIKDYYIHCDAALLGVMAPFFDPKPMFDFADGIDSISISGHKFIGSPIPCGVVLTKRQHRDRIANAISYVGTVDTTITGSRNGLSPLFMWYAIQKMGIKGLKNRLAKSQDLAAYTVKSFQSIGVNAWRNPQAITVVIPKPSIEICQRFQLASEDDIAHVITVPGISKKQIDDLVKAVRLTLYSLAS